MDLRQTACALVLVLSTAACGGKSPSSPSAPSPIGGATALTGATVQGQVRSTTGMTAATAGAAASGLTVSVPGTSISTTVSGVGQFVLNGVPAGSAQLNFSGPGVNATVSFSPVQDTETLSITVKISGAKAEIESEEHDHHGDLEINGTLSNLSGSASAFSFVVGGKTVHGDAQTSFFGDGNRQDSFATLRNGARVEVKGAMRDGLVYAQRIHVNGGDSGIDDDDDGEEPDSDTDDDSDHAGEVEAAGSISALTGTCPAISFQLNAKAVTTNASTEFKGAACSTLKNGDRVKVEGTKQSSGAILAKQVKRQ
jgi:hypothetical protein